MCTALTDQQIKFVFLTLPTTDSYVYSLILAFFSLKHQSHKNLVQTCQRELCKLMSMYISAQRFGQSVSGLYVLVIVIILKCDFIKIQEWSSYGKDAVYHGEFLSYQ